MTLSIQEMEGAIKELHALVSQNKTISVETMQQTILYKAVQDVSILDASGIGCSPETLLFVAKITATSPSIHTVYMSDNNLGKYGPAIATDLADSNTIHTVDMRDTFLTQCITGTSKIFDDYNLGATEIQGFIKSLSNLNIPNGLIDLIGDYAECSIEFSV